MSLPDRSPDSTPLNLPPSFASGRMHGLDALRACAMLLGIVYHVSLSFAFGFPWMVQDAQQSRALYWFQAFVHGFRMQLFFVVSGFFTAMLWRKKGLRALLWHRFRRVFLPCMLGLVTVVPAMQVSSGYAIQASLADRRSATEARTGEASIWGAIRRNDSDALRRHLQTPGATGALDPVFQLTPLTWSALLGRKAMAEILLESGVDVNGRNQDGGTALHAAAFLGNVEIVELLIAKGADIGAKNTNGDLPIRGAQTDMATLDLIAGYLGIEADHARVIEGRKGVLESLLRHGAGRDEGGPESSRSARPDSLIEKGEAVLNGLIQTPVFILIWFLWFLCWLIALFTLYAGVMNATGWRPPNFLTLSSFRLLWVIPLTVLPQWFMGSEFGPDTSMGIIPMPHVFFYYILFFFFGVAYYDSNDVEGKLGRSWRWSLPLTLLVIFPLALEVATGTLGIRNMLPVKFHRPVGAIVQSLYAWMMCLGCMGLFRSVLRVENRTVRYLSDSSYWLYLAHLPLTIWAQTVIRHWPGPAMVKCGLLSAVLTGFLLLTYQFLVRYTWLGRLLNGRRTRDDRGAGTVLPATVPVV